MKKIKVFESSCVVFWLTLFAWKTPKPIQIAKGIAPTKIAAKATLNIFDMYVHTVVYWEIGDVVFSVVHRIRISSLSVLIDVSMRVSSFTIPVCGKLKHIYELLKYVVVKH